MTDSFQAEITEIEPKQTTKDQFLSKFSPETKNAINDMLKVAKVIMQTDNLTGAFYVDPYDLKQATGKNAKIWAFIDDKNRIGMTERRKYGRSIIPLRSLMEEAALQIPGIQIESTKDPEENDGGNIVLNIKGTTIEIANTTRAASETLQEDGKSNIDLLRVEPKDLERAA